MAVKVLGFLLSSTLLIRVVLPARGTLRRPKGKEAAAMIPGCVF